MARLFGTDGVRGKAGEDLTAALSFQLGFSGARVLSEAGRGCILVGRDTRESGDMLFASLASGIMAAGLDVVDLGVIPTPAVAYLTGQDENARAGVVISASHNPYDDNGIKFFNTEGTKLPDSVEDEIEALMRAEDQPVAERFGRLIDGRDRAVAYVEYLKKALGTDLSGMKIAIDSANGATSSYAADMFRALGADVFVLSNTPDGRNINENCGSTHPEELFKAVAAGDFHVGFAYDGDGDRLIACDEKGTEMDGDDILAILALTLKNRGQLYDNTLVVTVMSNLGLELYCKDQGISVIRTAVGDRYIMEEMRKSGYNLGGEQSGHIIIRDILPTGDGMLTSLFLAAALKEKGGSMSELSSAMAKMPQVLINVKVKNKEGLKTNQTVLNAIRGGEEQLAGRGRILVRPSGTEPKVRVMVEGEDEAAIRSIAEAVATCIEHELV